MLWWHSLAGVAPGGVAQSRGDGVGSEAIGGCPPVTQNRECCRSARRVLPSRGPIALVELPSGGFGHKSARIAGPILPGVSKWFSSLAAENSPQRRTGPIKEALHPRTLSAGIVILADGLSRRRWRRGRSCPTLCDIQVAPTPVCPVPLGSSQSVPSFSLKAVKRNFLLWPIRNFSLWRDSNKTGHRYVTPCDARGDMLAHDGRRPAG